MARQRRKNAGDASLTIIIIVVLVWALTPLGLDLLGLEERGMWPSASTGGSMDDLPTSEASTQLRALSVRTEERPADIPDYNREEFGPAWADVDHNGCDTRNDILARDLARPTFEEGTHNCVVLTGTLADPYVGKTIKFKRGNTTSSKVQIDHVVALSDAWRSGAWDWSEEERREFANDPNNLLAVDGPANQQKSDASADQWLPSNKDFQCDYVKRQISVKSTYGLSVTESERDAMAGVLSRCAA